jgi:hypothetical protein
MNKQREASTRCDVSCSRQDSPHGGRAVNGRDASSRSPRAQHSTVERYAGEDIEPEERDYGALKAAVAEIYGTDDAELDAIDLDAR